MERRRSSAGTGDISFGSQSNGSLHGRSSITSFHQMSRRKSIPYSNSFNLLPKIPERPRISLHHATRDNRMDIVEDWLSLPNERHLDEKDSYGYTPLHYAAKFNRCSILKKLVEAGADPHIQTSEEKFTPLHFAARYTPRIIDEDAKSRESLDLEETDPDTSKQIVEFLVHYKNGEAVKVNEKAQFGWTPLHLACQRGNLAAVTTLLKCRNININIQDESLDSPLHEACLSGHCKIVEKLLQHMPHDDLTVFSPKNSELKTPLHFACHEGKVEVVKMLLAHVDCDHQKTSDVIETEDNESNTALHLACESGNKTVVSILVAKGANLLALKQDDVSPMHIAARHGFTDIAEELMTRGEDLLNRIDCDHRTPLHYAAAQNKVEMILLLLNHGADITATDMKSNTPLMLAASAGHVEAFTRLLTKRAAIDVEDKERQTVLHLAAKENHIQILQAILRDPKGARLVNSTDSNYNTALHLAASGGSAEAVRELLMSPKILPDAKNDLKKTPAHLAATKGHVPVIELLLKYKSVWIADDDEDGNTPLHLAALNGHPKCAKILLDSQADYHAKNVSLWTPLNCAAHHGHEKVVRVLIEAGAEVNPGGKQPTTPLLLAAQEGHLNVVKVLLDHRADIGKCSHGLNALDMAIDKGHQDIAIEILKSDHWKSALRNTSQSVHGNKVTTPLRKLIKKMPDVAELVFNRCTVSNETKDRHDTQGYSITFEYEFIEDFQDAKGDICSSFFKRHTVEVPQCHGDALADADIKSIQSNECDCTASSHWGPVGFDKKLHPLSIMVEHHRTDLLKHPLVTSLLSLKWRTFGRQFYCSNLLLFIIFVVTITAFGLVSLNPQSDTCVAVEDGTFRNATSEDIFYAIMEPLGCERVFSFENSSQGAFENTSDGVQVLSGQEVCSRADLQLKCGVSDLNCGWCVGLSSSSYAFLVIAATTVILVALVRILLEIFQLATLKLYYLLHWTNWLEMILFPSAIVFVLVYETDCLCPSGWQWQLGCIAVFLTWIDLIIFTEKMPLAGIYVLMFVHMFYTFCKAIILTMLLIFAFSFAFYMAFYDPADNFLRSSFATPGRAIVTTMVMTTGDFEYDAIFRQQTGGTAPGEEVDEIPFPPVSFLLWIIFLALMPILLANLLVGLAVDDIKGIQDAAVLKRLALKVELVLSIEELFPPRLRRHFIKEDQTVTPNGDASMLEKFRYRVFGAENSRFHNHEDISNALNPQPTPIEQVQTQTRNLVSDVMKIKESTMEQAERMAAMEKLIVKMAKRMEIYDEGEDLHTK